MISALKSIALLALPMMAAAQSSGTLETEANVQFLQGTCTAYIEVLEGEGENEILVCGTSNGMMYNVPQVDRAWIEEKRMSGELVSGATTLGLPENTVIDMDTFSLVLSGPPELLN